MRKPPEKGDIIVSRLGHDAGRAYVVTNCGIDGFVTLCDGQYRPADKQKRKSCKHLKFLAKSGLDLDSMNTEQMNTGIKRVLKEWEERNAERG